jgi:hypothetical protein
METVAQIGQALAGVVSDAAEALERQTKETKRLKKLEEIYKSSLVRAAARHEPPDPIRTAPGQKVRDISAVAYWMMVQLRVWQRKRPGKQFVLLRRVFALGEPGEVYADVDLMVGERGHDHAFNLRVLQLGPTTLRLLIIQGEGYGVVWNKVGQIQSRDDDAIAVATLPTSRGKGGL